MSHIRSEVVKVRKPHQCWGCCDTIPVGTSAYFSVQSDEGRMCSAYWCETCHQTMIDHRDEIDPYGDGVLLGEIAEWSRCTCGRSKK